MIIKIKYLTLIFLLLDSVNLHSSEFNFQVEDTLIPSGRIYSIPIFGNIPINSTGVIEVSFKFNGLVLDIKSIKGSSEIGFQDNQIQYSMNSSNWEEAVITLNSSNYKSGYSGVLFYFDIEALVGPDTISIIEPISVRLNGTSIGAELVKGYIRTTSPIINQKYPEGIGRCFPNPFTYNGYFKFNVEKESKVKFSIFNCHGRLLQSTSSMNNYLDIAIFNSSMQIIPSPADHIFQEGSYLLKLTPASQEMSAGLYIIVMETRYGVHNSNFVYIR